MNEILTALKIIITALGIGVAAILIGAIIFGLLLGWSMTLTNDTITEIRELEEE